MATQNNNKLGKDGFSVLEKYFLNIITSLTFAGVCAVGTFQVQAGNRLTALEVAQENVKIATMKRYDTDDANKDREINRLNHVVLQKDIEELKRRLNNYDNKNTE